MKISLKTVVISLIFVIVFPAILILQYLRSLFGPEKEIGDWESSGNDKSDDNDDPYIEYDYQRSN